MVRQYTRALKRFGHAVRADYAAVRRYQAKYHAENVPEHRYPVDVVQKIGVQMMLSVRVMSMLHEARVPLAPKLLSRLIRHAFGAEIHWQASLEPGVSLVHGNGLVISHSARIGPGCILFHNVTLGEGIDAETRRVGAPTLGEDVHVGPGATLIGPIEVGAGSKIMAGVVLSRSVPPYSLVKAAEPEVVPRRANGA
jgi:serine O-acetyltransferase